MNKKRIQKYLLWIKWEIKTAIRRIFGKLKTLDFKFN